MLSKVFEILTVALKFEIQTLIMWLNIRFLYVTNHPKFRIIRVIERESEEKMSESELLSLSLSLIFVESEGFEPSSKRRVFKLSTCLFLDWFSIAGRTRTPKPTT